MDTQELIARAEATMRAASRDFAKEAFSVLPDLIAALRAEKEARERAEEHARAGWALATHWQNRYAERAMADDAALDRMIREAEMRGQAKAGAIFETAGAEARYIEDGENACPACGGSGHKDDASAALDRFRQEAADEALERAVRMIEQRWHSENTGSQSLDVGNAWRNGEARAIAAAIRALKGGA